MEILFYDHDLAVCVKPVGLDSEAQVPAELKKRWAGRFSPSTGLTKMWAASWFTPAQNRLPPPCPRQCRTALW
ncbi:MAG: hypothetical protein ACLS4A_11740 [Oscillospiraceae bacterium]